MQPLPLAPKLNLLVLGDDGDDELQCPISLVKTWQFNETVGKQFSAWLDKFAETYKIADSTPAGDGPGTPSKNKRALPNGSPMEDRGPEKTALC